MNKAVILLSGGLDSVASAAFVRHRFDEILALTFNYGQKSFLRESTAAKKISEYYKFCHETVDITWLGKISPSALNTSENIPEIENSDLNNADYMQNTAKAVTVPNRNALFVNIAACYAEAGGYNTIVIGANKEEAATFPDNSVQFTDAINISLKNSVSSRIYLEAPFIDMTKRDIVDFCIKDKVPFNLIYSCYNSGEKHCGKCESCKRLLRALKLNNAYDIIKDIFGDSI